MFDKYLIRKNSLVNVYDVYGKAIGFKMAVKNSNYRGVFVSLHNGYYLVVDDVVYPREVQRFEVNGKAPRTFDEIKNAGYEHWDHGDEAWLYVEKEGGLTPGEHKILFKQAVFAAYGYFPGCEEYVTNTPVPGPVTKHYLIMDKTYYPVEYNLELQDKPIFR